jgi:SPP1 gp7 family putative phage head morphogenesis protein
LNYIGLQAPFTIIPIGAVRNQAERFRERLVNYSNQQASQISAVVEQGLIQGWGTRKIEGQLKTLGVSFKSNAETIARTETMSAYNGAAKSRYEQAGVAYVQWIATPAEGTCSLCYARNTKAWKTTEAPAIPAHPRCRCTYLPTASLSDIDTAFYEDYSKQGLDDLERQGLQPDNGPTYWEKKAGVSPAKPSWVPGQAVPVAPVAAKPAPVVKAYNPDTVYKTEGELIDRISKTSSLIGRIARLKSGEVTTIEGVQYSREDAIAKLKSDNATEKRNLLIMALNKLEDMDKALKNDPNSLRFAPNVFSQDDGHDWLQPKLYGIQSNITFSKKGDAIYIDDNQGNSVPIYIPDPKQMLALVQKYQPMIKRIDTAAGTKPVNLDSQLDDLAEIHGVSRAVAKDRVAAVEHFSGPEYPGIRAGDGDRPTYYTEDGKKKDTTPWHREQAKLINDYINDSPKYDGVIYRGFRQDTVDGAAYVEDIKKALRSKDGYSLRSFSSFSSNYEIAQNFAVLTDGDDPPEAFLVEVKRNTRGASIRSVSTITDEDEVMVPKATRYRYIGERVVEVLTPRGGTTRVTVYEVEEF